MASSQFPSFDGFALPLQDDATVVPTSPHSSSDDADVMFSNDDSSDYVMNFLMRNPSASSKQPSYQPGNPLYDLVENLESGEEECYFTSSVTTADLFAALSGPSSPRAPNSRHISPSFPFPPLLSSSAAAAFSPSSSSSSPPPALLAPHPNASAAQGMTCASPTPSSTGGQHNPRSGGSGSNSYANAADRRQAADPGRNARMAKENRERKKKYVAELEAKIASLQREKDEAHAQAATLQADLTKASQEITSLRTMLQNSSALAQVLAALGSSAAVSFKPPVAAAAAAAKRPATDALDGDSSQAAPSTKRPATRRSRAAADSDAACDAAGVARVGAPMTVLPIQLNIHVHSADTSSISSSTNF